MIAETKRLVLRRMTLDDAPFLCGLLNEPSWLENIGDRGVRTTEDAQQFIRDKVWAMYETYGFGMYTVNAKKSRRPIGVCGVVRRDTLPGPDLGFALLPEFWGQGYAFEAAHAVVRHAREVLGLPPLLAITTQDNARSGRLLNRLGFEYQGLVRLAADDAELRLYRATA